MDKAARRPEREWDSVKKRIQRGFRLLRNDLHALRYAILVIGIYYLAVHFLFGQFCPMMIVLHLPCPGCGMTRALWLVLSGRWVKAWNLQPLVFGWIGLGSWFGVRRYLLGRTEPSKWMQGLEGGSRLSRGA